MRGASCTRDALPWSHANFTHVLANQSQTLPAPTSTVAWNLRRRHRRGLRRGGSHDTMGKVTSSKRGSELSAPRLIRGKGGRDVIRVETPSGVVGYIATCISDEVLDAFIKKLQCRIARRQQRGSGDAVAAPRSRRKT